MARAIEADIICTKLSKDVWCQTFIVLVVIVLHIRRITSRVMIYAYDLECGPHAARVIEIVTTLDTFAQDFADAIGVPNCETLPPAALMAEWAVRCVYSDGVNEDTSHDCVMQRLDNDGHNVAACQFVADTLGLQSTRNAKRFVYAAHVYITQGRRVGNGLWPDVHVLYARCPRANTMMHAAAQPVCDENNRDTQVQLCGKALLSQAKFVLPARRSTINCTGSSTSIVKS